MKKTLFILSLTIISLCSQTVNFKETKFVEALELYTYRDGNVSYDDVKTIVRYRDGKTITKVDNNLTVHGDDNELLTTINLNEKPEVALYFRLTKALFSKNFESLKENFKIEKRDKKYQFEPTDDTKEVVSNIELSLKADESVDFFIINFTNRDTIKIEAK
ncbi:hypothetical protein GSY74_10460 [Sulfurovum sp. bin170]|uniref:hypothetical protein n=1 Tax=Sulfurovum sp. bin170 TaxID=2695268 RepID=UPI0013E05CC4|nr:hypothetical protein [Sulfurovum sp. bin170]NEW61708.1 hypothetical protein [Sulfurovum sp. bin170]